MIALVSQHKKSTTCMKMEWNKKKRTNNELKVLSKSHCYNEHESKLDSEICLVRWLWRYLDFGSIFWYLVAQEETFLCRIILVASAEIEGGCWADALLLFHFLFYKSLVTNTRHFVHACG